MDIPLTDIEQAINYWRRQRPSTGEENALSPEVAALADVYALMIFHGQRFIAPEKLTPVCASLIQSWRATLHSS